MKWRRNDDDYILNEATDTDIAIPPRLVPRQDYQVENGHQWIVNRATKWQTAAAASGRSNDSQPTKTAPKTAI